MAFIYVDGFNLYNRALRGKRTASGHWESIPGLKWLDLRALAQRMMKGDPIERIKYFTARISGRTDPGAPRRQQVYLKALSSLPELEFYFGTFKNRTKRRPLVNPIQGYPRFQEFHDTEEKGSDVNLAAHLVFDACQGNFKVAAVISNDTDLVEPIALVTQRLGLPVILLAPCVPHEELCRVATAKRQIHRRDIKKSQFCGTVHVDGATVTRPPSW